MKKKNIIQELISRKEMESWSKNETIIITAGTGVGKSYFIKNDLYKYAKENNQKILFLIHRLNCVKQFQEELEKDNKTDVIDIKTYQSIEWKELKGYDNDLSKYDYIVCDEFHYFISDADSKFNITTDLSLNKILEQKATKIFMSASAEAMSIYIKNVKKIKVKEYNVPINYNFIETLEFFYTDAQLEKILKEYIEQNKKAIFFINDLDKATELYKKYKKHCLFNCSKSATKEYNKFVYEEDIEDMLSNCRFEETILITTSTMDTGVNIIDDELKNIITYNIFDINLIKQCIGRKRLKEDEKIKVIIHAKTNSQLNGISRDFQKRTEMANFLKRNGTDKFIEKYPRELDHSRIIYDKTNKNGENEKVTNGLLLLKIQLMFKEVWEMLGCGTNTIKHGFIKFISKKLGFKFKEVKILENEQKTNNLIDYLNGLVDKKNIMLQVKDRKELIEKIDVKSDGKLLRKINTLNEALEERNINFRIVEFQTSKIIEGKKKNFKSAWKIVEI